MANNKKLEIQSASFTQDLPIFLNFQNKVTCEEFELSIENNLLYVFNRKTSKTEIVPLYHIAVLSLK